MTTNRPMLIELSSLLQEIASDPNMRHVATYAGAIAELAHLHETIAALPTYSPERMRAFEATRKPWKAATVFAAKYGLQHPTDALREMGYSA
jgi:hypothetical protein